MKDDTITLQVQRVAGRRAISLTPAGWDLLRAVVLSWVGEAEKGYFAAKEMAQYDTSGFAKGQAEYFKNGGSFLTGCISRIPKKVYRVDDIVRLIRNWPEGMNVPEEWKEWLIRDNAMRGNDEPGLFTGGGCGSGGDGGSGEHDSQGGTEPVREQNPEDHIGHRKPSGTAGGKRAKQCKTDRGSGVRRGASGGGNGAKPGKPATVKPNPKRSGDKGAGPKARKLHRDRDADKPVNGRVGKRANRSKK